MNNTLPRTREEVIQKLAKDPRINRNWLNSLARESGVDFDEDTKDEFNREFNQE